MLGDFVETGRGGINGFIELGIVYAEFPWVDADDGTCLTFKIVNKARLNRELTILLMELLYVQCELAIKIDIIVYLIPLTESS